MKLRKIGNSLGTTFSQDILSKAGFEETDELEVTAVLDEIVIRPAMPNGHMIEFTLNEAKAIVKGLLGTKSGQSAIAKIQHSFQEEKMNIPTQVNISMHAQTAKLVEKRRSMLAAIQAARDPSGNVHPLVEECTKLTQEITTRLGNAALEAIEDGRNVMYPG